MQNGRRQRFEALRLPVELIIIQFSALLFLGQTQHKYLDGFFAFWSEVLDACVWHVVNSRSVRIFLLERHMTLDHADELTTGPGTVLD